MSDDTFFRRWMGDGSEMNDRKSEGSGADWPGASIVISPETMSLIASHPYASWISRNARRVHSEYQPRISERSTDSSSTCFSFR